MHGEYKVPGGKLVTVDCAVVDGRFARVRVGGDFFLEPDEALGRIGGALEGLPVTARAGEIAAAVTARLEPGDALIGFAPRDVGFALRRAVGAATTWDDHVVELIEDGPRDPYTQMALDQVYAEALSRGTRGPTLRLWEWGASAVVIGSFQSLANEVDAEGAARHGVTVVRRVSGGGAMFVEPGNTITYSLVVPGSLVDGLSFEESYEFLDRWVLVALGELGVAATYAPINDITSPAGKIAGAAQKRLADGTVLHHVTMAYDIDATKMLEVLRIGREKLAGKGIASANKRVDPLRSQTQLARAEIVAAFVASFGRQHTLVRSRVTPEEAQAAQALVAGKFATPEWISRVP
ncbi:MAG: lipoate--protein ligase family protein [Propionibacteriaceae bacterium]|jgi:lipoate-protein ligase A|nr:lipoate--protein ligase family protein [Propionibacteriaceae bacterium]